MAPVVLYYRPWKLTGTNSRGTPGSQEILGPNIRVHMDLGASQEKKSVKHGENALWPKIAGQNCDCGYRGLQLSCTNRVSQFENWRALPPPVGREGE